MPASQPTIDITGEKMHAVGFTNVVRYVMGELPQNERSRDALRKR